ncbi:hypothetical protein [Hydrogenophaga sp.]|uniref:hypothetical protein n=1 Tax=Hydrogenophaga sp. TaxID=1904254 RepID=UPI002717C036|nr:hypothetical protein [Hydrogenophaga sp.]MDO9434324.1 hypothetical protein [Hydrogenophaga sp.]
MTRIAAGPLVCAPRTQPPASIQEQPGRARTPQGALVSLAEPPFGAENQSLEAVLLERVARCATPMPANVSAKELQHVNDAVERRMPFDTLTEDPGNGPGPVLRDWTDQDEAATRLLTDAVDVILALDQRDDVPTTTDGVVLQEAVHLLLALGQPALLRRLAQLNVSSHMDFQVGLNPRSVSVLERIGASWPSEASVSITLDSGLSTACVHALRAFLLRPTSLSVHVRASGTRDTNAAREFAQLVGQRPLAQLTLDIHEWSTELLQAMLGVKAATVCIRASRLLKKPDPSRSPTAAHPLAEDLVLAYQDAAFELVRKSGARAIQLPQSHLEGAFCARLLAMNTHWDAVELNLSKPSAAKDWLIAARQTIVQLALTSWTGKGAADMADLLAWAEKNRVSSLVFHDTVNVRHVADGLRMRLLKSTHVFESIEACFACDAEDADVWDTNRDVPAYGVLQAVLSRMEALLNNPLVTSLRHTSPAALQNDRPSPQVGGLIPDEVRDTLHAQGDSNRGVPARQRLADCWRSTIQTLGTHLFADADIDIDDFMSYLMLPVSPLLEPIGALEKLPHFEEALAFKLAMFKRCGLDTRLIHGAVAHCVRERPAMGLEMVDALVAVGLQSRQLTAQDWSHLGARYAMAWIGGGLEGDEVHGGGAGAGTSTPPSSAALPGARMAPEPVLHPHEALLMPRTNPMALVTPSTPQALEDATRAYEEFVRAADDDVERVTGKHDALRLVLQLLQFGTFDPKVLDSDKVANELARHLLHNGHGTILKHIIHHTHKPRVWRLDATDAGRVADIARLRPWPTDPACQCDLFVGTSLGREDLARLADFAARVKPEQLTVRLDAFAYPEPEQVTHIVNARPGIALALRGMHEGRLPEARPLVALLAAVNVPLRALAMEGPGMGGEALGHAVIDLIRTCNVSRLDMLDTESDLTHAVLSCRHWEWLKVEGVFQASAPFVAGRVSARELHLVAPPQLHKFGPMACTTMVATCKGLHTVVFDGAAVNALHLAQGLDGNRGVRSVEAPLATSSDADASEALKILRRNTSIVRVKWRDTTRVGKGLMPLKPGFHAALAQLVTRNRLRHSASLRGQAVNSLTFTVARRDLGRLGQQLEDMLDPEDILALSRTNKAAYARSRLPWEREIDRLAALFFAAASGVAFQEQLVLQLTQLDVDFLELAGTEPFADTTANTVLEKVAAMMGAGVPREAVVQALGRALSLDKDASMAYLEAMLVMGALPSEVWLKEVLGIEAGHPGVPL